ncbi:MAG: LacI family DNA-binding transcriptional regulator [Candidatus Saccharibacteria bacterium]|nr:LacI family DNA-binding transcriptional regulator [Candidatus Saccharibacteria bacterium]
MGLSISDIAKLAGVSHSTVSRVLNDAPIRISAQKREQIIQIAQRMNYIPNRSAQALKTGRHGRIAVIAYDITDAFAVECVSAVETILSGSPYHALWMSCAHADKKETDPLNLLTEVAQSVDGIIIILADNYLTDTAILKFWAATHLPLVTVIRRVSGDVISSVTIDNEYGTTILMEYLLKLGHEQIAFCYCNPPNQSASGRYEVYQQIVKSKHLPVDLLQVPVDGTASNGYSAGMKLLNTPKKPTAIIGFDDLTAIGVIKACFDMGVKVPAEVSVAAFDNIRMAEISSPSLTTVSTDYSELAQMAIDELNNQINQPNLSNYIAKHHISKPALITRQSTAIPKSKV